MMSCIKHNQRKQSGSMLLEALVSILIFSIGILAIIGLQANSIKISTDAKFRSDASLLANQYISSMWANLAAAVTASSVGVATPFNQAQFSGFNSGGASFNTWYNNNVFPALPNASAIVATNTVITCGTSACPANPAGVQQNTTTTATVTINWTQPGGGAHAFSTVATLSAQKQL